MYNQPSISVVIPVYNGSRYLNQCLDALIKSSYKPREIIVVDDGSTDDSVEISLRRGVTVFELPQRSGPAAARNHGAQNAQGDILLFVDSDVSINEKTIARLAANFMNNPDIVAVFGSYDDSPYAADFLSQFRNLLHHFIHQSSHKEAKTFWTGCGAIYKKTFFELGGFDEGWFSIEDIELGHRIWNNGYQIMLDKGLQVKHLKHWGWRNWLKTDIFYRAVPWSRLILLSGYLPHDLNLQTPHIISALLVDLLILTIPLSFIDTWSFFGMPLNAIFILLSLLFIITLIILNRRLYNLFLHKKGIKFTILAIPTHFFYYFYSSIAFAVCWILSKFVPSTVRLKKLNALQERK
ncbi:MAG: glycosyltransferase [Candidatus Dadabacteria bacterium]|nr:glycosyltransferase [Candidatus Dadabacteria bacterium]